MTELKTVTYPLKKAIPCFIRYFLKSLAYDVWYIVSGVWTLKDGMRYIKNDIEFHWRQCRGPVYTWEVSEFMDSAEKWTALRKGILDIPENCRA